MKLDSRLESATIEPRRHGWFAGTRLRPSCRDEQREIDRTGGRARGGFSLGTAAFCVVVFGLCLAGCTTGPDRKAPQVVSAARDQIQRRLTEIFDAAERKDFERLDRYHLYGPQFTKFAAEVPDRQGAQASRDGEHVGLGRVEGLVMRAKDLQIDVFSETGVATFVLDYSFRVGANVVPKQVRCTMVFVRDHGEWRIAHEHLSALPTAP